jgi:hypothetical protein
MSGLASAFLNQTVERAPVSRKSSLALGAAALVIGATAFVATPSRAESDDDQYQACITAARGAWLFPVRCHHDYGHRCARPVHHGRAFRVLRQKGGYLLVRNLQARGWIELNSVRFAPQAYCRAAGI